MSAGRKLGVSSGEVLDASAVLALLQREPGAEQVDLVGSVMNSVNFAEVVQKSVERGRPVDTLLQELTLLGLILRPFSLEEAQLAGELIAVTRPYGLSLADRACLATAKHLGCVAVTADRNWAVPEHGVKVRNIR